MAGALSGARHLGEALDTHLRIIWALILRELSTRYGRNDIGFLWVMVEPMAFAGAVSALWSAIRPPFEFGVRVIPFTVTGYMGLILIRQTTGFVVNAVKVNQALLYHRLITPLHIFIARFIMESLGITFAYIIIVLILMFFGLMGPPHDLLVVIAGWLLLAWMAFGLALIMGALAELFEFVERFVQIVTYILIPVSGAFIMAYAMPPSLRHWVMVIPFIHAFEIMRGAYFGEFLKTYYDVPYAMACSAGMTLLGLTLVQFVRGRIDVE